MRLSYLNLFATLVQLLALPADFFIDSQHTPLLCRCTAPRSSGFVAYAPIMIIEHVNICSQCVLEPCSPVSKCSQLSIDILGCIRARPFCEIRPRMTTIVQKARHEAHTLRNSDRPPAQRFSGCHSEYVYAVRSILYNISALTH